MRKKKSNIIIWVIVVASILVIGVTCFFLLKSSNNCDGFIETYDKSKCECQKQFSTEYVNNLNTELGKLSNIEKLVKDQEKKMETNGLNKEGCPKNAPYRSRLARDKSDNYNVCYKNKECSINPNFYKNNFERFCQAFSMSKLKTIPINSQGVYDDNGTNKNIKTGDYIIFKIDKVYFSGQKINTWNAAEIKDKEGNNLTIIFVGYKGEKYYKTIDLSSLWERIQVIKNKVINTSNSPIYSTLYDLGWKSNLTKENIEDINPELDKRYYQIPNKEVKTWEKQIKYYNLKDKIEEVKNNKVFSQGCDNFLSDPNTLLKNKSKIKNKFAELRLLLKKMNSLSILIENNFKFSNKNPIVDEFNTLHRLLYYNVIYYYYRYNDLKDNEDCKCNQTKYIQDLSQSIDFTKATQNPKKDELNIQICKTKGKCFNKVVYGFEDKKAKSTHGRTKILGDPENLIKIFKKMGTQLYKDTVTKKEDQLSGNTKTYKKVLEDNGFNTIIEKMQNIWNQCRVLLGITGYCFVKKTCDSKNTVDISKKFGSGENEINKYILCQNIPK